MDFPPFREFLTGVLHPPFHDLKGRLSKPANLQLPTLKLSPTSATYPHTSDKSADLSSTWATRPAAKHFMRPQMLVVPRPLLVYYHACSSCSYTWHIYTGCFPNTSPQNPILQSVLLPLYPTQAVMPPLEKLITLRDA